MTDKPLDCIGLPSTAQVGKHDFRSNGSTASEKHQDLGELFRTAREYGRVRIMTMDDGAYHACIVFDSIEHTKLEANSGFRHSSPEEAMQHAIVAARKIVDSIQKLAKTLPESKLLD